MIRFRSVLCAIAVATVAASAFSQQTELRIVTMSPRGETPTSDQSQTIFVTFNQPMVPLQAVSTQDGSTVMRISPAIPGKYRWMGTTTLAFIPSKPLPRATHFAITIDPGTKSLAGQPLQAGARWEFETPRPHIISTIPNQSQKFVELRHSIILHFDQPVDPQTVAKYVSIQRSTGVETVYPAFTARAPSIEEYKRSWEKLPREDSVNVVLLTPAEDFKKGSTIRVLCKAGLTAMEGPLGMKADYLLNFTTYNEFSFGGVTSDFSFNPGYPIKFLFSNPVSFRDLVSHVSFDPPLKVREDYYDNSYSSDELTVSPLTPIAARGSVRRTAGSRSADRSCP